VLEKQNVHDWCSFIVGLCIEAGCVEPSELCTKVAEAVLESEEKYLELRAKLQKCGEQRPLRRQPSERALYVA